MKKHPIYYYHEDDVDRVDGNINEILQPCSPATSTWLDSFNLFHSGIKSLKDWWGREDTSPTDPLPFTVKTCPGIGDLFSSSMLVKFPSDFLLHIDTNENKDEWFVKYNSSNNMLKVESHPRRQYINDKSALFHNMLNIKFIYELKIVPTFNGKIMYLPPSYHVDDIPYEVLPGFINHYKNSKVHIIINTMFPFKKETYYFKAGTPLAYMTFLDTKMPMLQPKNLDNILAFSEKRKSFFRYYRSYEKN